jgi:glycosidase
MLYQINTRVLLGEIGPRATLDDLPDALLDDLAGRGFRWVWPLGVWQTGPAGREVSASRPDWVRGYRAILPDLRASDITGSPYAIRAYAADADFGGPATLARLRDRLRRRGQKLMLDFVPNHVSLDHPWAAEHPGWFIAGAEADLAREPSNWVRVGAHVLAHGRDPHFPGWPDTLQLNYSHPGLRAAMREQLLAVARCCDGVRCDMAMLLLPDVFQRTWGGRARPADGTAADEGPFWPEAVAGVRREVPGFRFLAEVYWDLEWVMQQQGFDWTYDKRLYDRLRDGNAAGVRAHLTAGRDFQDRCARFLENHDEPRAAAVFPWPQHRAAAVVTYLTPGLRFLHEGQLTGRRVHVSIHLGRRPAEPPDPELAAFYDRLLACVKDNEEHPGEWRLCECRPAWEGNPTARNFIAWLWEGPAGRRTLAAVNYAPTQGQCHVSIPADGLAGGEWELRDALGDAVYRRPGDELAGKGLYLDLPAWGCHVFRVARRCVG